MFRLLSPAFFLRRPGFLFLMKITFIIGGARSGKSSFALKKASEIEGLKAYIATAEALDGEMKERIDKHRAERGSEWDTYEEPLKLPDILLEIKNKYSVAVLDCLTIWLSNILLRSQTEGPEQQTINESLRNFTGSLKDPVGLQLFIVSNEVGMGIVPENRLARQFRDLAGKLNQEIAKIADEVYLVIAGIPIKIK
jgi:adenosylcobinamide kinase/adenosylcobinamide-phosphate guanylyltransferase